MFWVSVHPGQTFLSKITSWWPMNSSQSPAFRGWPLKAKYTGVLELWKCCSRAHREKNGCLLPSKSKNVWLPKMSFQSPWRLPHCNFRPWPWWSYTQTKWTLENCLQTVPPQPVLGLDFSNLSSSWGYVLCIFVQVVTGSAAPQGALPQWVNLRLPNPSPFLSSKSTW